MSATQHIAAIILAAGQSTRMGDENKLLCEWKGKPLLQHVLQAVMDSNLLDVTVITGHEAEQVTACVQGYEAAILYNPDYETGMASSVVKGVESLRGSDCEAMMVLLGDMPNINADIINSMIGCSTQNHHQNIVVATSEGKRGNPVIFPSRFFDDLTKLEGDRGAKQIFARNEASIVELEVGSAARMDLDTPESFQQ